MFPPFLAVAATLSRVSLQIDGDVTIEPGVGLVSGAVSAFVTTLIVGGILVALAPEYTEGRIAAVTDDPVGSFVYGFAVFLAFILVMIVLAITIIGLLVVIPLALVLYVLWAFGSAVGFLAIADRFVGHEDGWLVPLLIAAGLNAALVLSAVGGIVGLVVGAAGFGAVMEEYL